MDRSSFPRHTAQVMLLICITVRVWLKFIQDFEIDCLNFKTTTNGTGTEITIDYSIDTQVVVPLI